MEIRLPWKSESVKEDGQAGCRECRYLESAAVDGELLDESVYKGEGVHRVDQLTAWILQHITGYRVILIVLVIIVLQGYERSYLCEREGIDTS